MTCMRRLLLPLHIAAFTLAGCGEPPRLRGTKAAPARVEATVSSLNSGTVRAEKVAELAFGAVGRVQRLNVRLGQQVRKDEILAELENRDLVAQLSAAEAEARRELQLVGSKATSQVQYEQARALYDTALVAFQKTQIKAPYDGIIAELNLEVGQLSQITAVIPKALIRIVDVEPRYVRAELDEVDLPRIRVGMPARIKVLAVRKQPFAGTVRMVTPYVSTVREQDRTAEFELTVENEGVLLPAGASADVEVITDAVDAALAVPGRAVMGRGGERYLYCYQGGRAVRTPVRIGIYNYDRVEIAAGLEAGEIVLIPAEGVELKDGLRVALELQAWP